MEEDEVAAWRKQFADAEAETWEEQAKKASRSKKPKKHKKKRKNKVKEELDAEVVSPSSGPQHPTPHVVVSVRDAPTDLDMRSTGIDSTTLRGAEGVNEPSTSSGCMQPVRDIRAGFSEAEIAAMQWRQHGMQRDRLSPGRHRRPSRRRRRSLSSSSSRSSSYSSSYSSRSRSRSIDSNPPADPKLNGHCNRSFANRKFDLTMPPWQHDKFSEVIREPSPERQLPDDYVPPEPEWYSRAGGVCIPNRRAWLNEAREERKDYFAAMKG